MDSTLSFAVSLLTTAMLTEDTDADAVSKLAGKLMGKELTYICFKNALTLMNDAIAQVEAQRPDWKSQADLVTQFAAAASATLPAGMIMQDTSQ